MINFGSGSDKHPFFQRLKCHKISWVPVIDGYFQIFCYSQRENNFTGLKLTFVLQFCFKIWLIPPYQEIRSYPEYVHRIRIRNFLKSRIQPKIFLDPQHWAWGWPLIGDRGRKLYKSICNEGRVTYLRGRVWRTRPPGPGLPLRGSRRGSGPGTPAGSAHSHWAQYHRGPALHHTANS